MTADDLDGVVPGSRFPDSFAVELTFDTCNDCDHENADAFGSDSSVWANFAERKRRLAQSRIGESLLVHSQSFSILGDISDNDDVNATAQNDVCAPRDDAFLNELELLEQELDIPHDDLLRQLNDVSRKQEEHGEDVSGRNSSMLNHGQNGGGSFMEQGNGERTWH